MDLYGIVFGIWFGVGCYRLVELWLLDAESLEEGFNPADEYDVGPIAYRFWTVISAFGWPIFMPVVYFTNNDDDDEE
ncbi:hypothetical protein LCGC14_0407320 [marine sediment metagenome]|uniref:Uncharacterized protein n=1 Tax=marine sediment metagenome TaxID=412755 RepID=A0A0F9SUZ8_9ZZZZ